MCLDSLQVCKAPRPRPELHYGDTNIVLRATRGLLDLCEEGSKSNSEVGPGETRGCSKPSSPAQERSSGFVLTPSSVWHRVHRCVRHSAGEIKGPCLWFLVVGHCLVGLGEIQELVLSKLLEGQWEWISSSKSEPLG